MNKAIDTLSLSGSVGIAVCPGLGRPVGLLVLLHGCGVVFPSREMNGFKEGSTTRLSHRQSIWLGRIERTQHLVGRRRKPLSLSCWAVDFLVGARAAAGEIIPAAVEVEKGSTGVDHPGLIRVTNT